MVKTWPFKWLQRWPPRGSKGHELNHLCFCWFLGVFWKGTHTYKSKHLFFGRYIVGCLGYVNVYIVLCLYLSIFTAYTYIYIYIHPPTNSSHLQGRSHPKRKQSSSNHPIFGANMLVSGRVNKIAGRNITIFNWKYTFNLVVSKLVDFWPFFREMIQFDKLYFS